MSAAPRFPCGAPGCEACAEDRPADCDYAAPPRAPPPAEPAPVVVSLAACPHGRRPGAWCAECAASRLRRGGGAP